MPFFSKITEIKRKLLASSFIAILVLSIGLPSLTLYPKKVNAQLRCVGSVDLNEIFGGLLSTSVPVDDKKNNSKEGCLDAIAWNLAKLAVRQITRSLVNWINTGFQGNPAFISDPASFFADIADNAIGEYLRGTAFGLLCSPFQAQIRLAILLNRNRSQKAQCTLSGILNNAQNFQKYVSISGYVGQGSGAYVDDWTDWYRMAALPQGNIYGAYEAAQAELSLRIASKTFAFGKELDFGSGFLSWRDCTGIPAIEQGSNKEGCNIVTPGRTIADQLNGALGRDSDALVTADEVDEIISALAAQLLSQVFGGQGGLLGVSRPNGSFGGSSFLDAVNVQDINALSGSREFSRNGADTNIATLQQAIDMKNQSMGRVDTSIGLQNLIIQTFGAGSPQAGAANAVISTQLQPLRNRIGGDIATYNSYIAQLNQIKSDLAALVPDDINGSNDLLNQYLILLDQIRPELVTRLAQTERDSSVPQQLNPLDAAAQAILNGTGQGNDPSQGSDGGR